MRAGEAYAHLKADVLRLIRDRFLVGMTVYILVIAVVIRWMLPYVSQRLAPDIDLSHYYPLINSYLSAVSGSIMVGAIGGLLLLETREERTLDALRVSPMPVRRMLAYEAIFVFLAAVPVIAAMAAIIGVGGPAPVPGPPFLSSVTLLGISMAAATSAPVVALAISTLASDKVEAFAWMKIVGLCATVTLAAWFIPEPWQWLAVVMPPFSAAKAWWVAADGQGAAWLWLGLAFVVNGLYFWRLVRRWVRLA